MRRLAAGVGLVLFLILLPIGLVVTVGGPFVPTVNISEVSEFLRGSYVPMDSVAKAIGLVCWVLWFYVLFVFAIRLAAALVAPRSYRLGNALITASGAITPRFLRRALDFALGGTLLLSTVGGIVASAPRPLSASVAVAHPATGTPDSPVDDRPASPAPAHCATEYVVKPGDSLWEIAERQLGSGYRWREIYELNRDRRFPDGRVLTSPRLIQPGWVLELPSPANGLSAPAEASTVPPVAAPSVPSPSPATPEPSSTLEAEEEEEEEAPTPARPAVIRLPSGGVIATSFASGVLTAQALAALRRRRARRALRDPDDFGEPSLVLDLRRQVETPGVGHLQTAAAEVGSQWRRVYASLPRILLGIEERERAVFFISQAEEDSGLLPPSNERIGFRSEGAVVRAEVRRPFSPKAVRGETPAESGLLIPLGVTRNDSAVHLGLHGTGGLSVRGPGAAGFARQAILACAADSSCDDLEIYLIGDLEQFGDCARLNHVRKGASWNDCSDLLHGIQAEILRRARLFAEEDAENVWDYSARCAEDRIPSVLIVATQPTPAMVGVAEGIVTQAGPLGCAFLAVGWKPQPLTFAVEVDSKILVSSPISEVPEKLSPFELGSEQIEQIVEIINRARPPGWEDEAEDAPPSATPEQRESELAPSPNGSRSVGAVQKVRKTLPDEEPLPIPTEIAPSPVDQTLEVRSFGSFTIIKDGRLVEKGLRSKARELLALLVAHPQGLPQDRIIDSLWPDLDAMLGGIEFDRALYSLRKRTGSGRDHVERINETYRLNLEHWWTDAAAFESLLSRAGSLAAEEAIEMLSQALELYAAPFCDDCYFPWAEPIRDRYRSLFVKSSARLGNLLMEYNRPDDALFALDRAVEVDPINEDLYRRAMAIEGRLGRRKAVSERFNKLQAILQDELDEDPDEETAELFRKVMSEIERTRKDAKR